MSSLSLQYEKFFIKELRHGKTISKSLICAVYVYTWPMLKLYTVWALAELDTDTRCAVKNRC